MRSWAWFCVCARCGCTGHLSVEVVLQEPPSMVWLAPEPRPSPFTRYVYYAHAQIAEFAHTQLHSARARVMKSTKVQNPRRISRIKPICAVIGDAPRCSSTPGQFSLLCGLAASVCLVRDKAKSATPSLQNNPPRCVERTNCQRRTWITLVVMRRIISRMGRRGVGSRNYTHAHSL